MKVTGRDGKSFKIDGTALWVPKKFAVRRMGNKTNR